MPLRGQLQIQLSGGHLVTGQPSQQGSPESAAQAVSSPSRICAGALRYSWPSSRRKVHLSAESQPRLWNQQSSGSPLPDQGSSSRHVASFINSAANSAEHRSAPVCSGSTGRRHLDSPPQHMGKQVSRCHYTQTRPTHSTSAGRRGAMSLS